MEAVALIPVLLAQVVLVVAVQEVQSLLMELMELLILVAVVAQQVHRALEPAAVVVQVL